MCRVVPPKQNSQTQLHPAGRTPYARVATGFATLFQRLEQEVHYHVYAGECHDVSGQRYKVTRRTSISLHKMAFHTNLSARGRKGAA